ncbi:hypothetical protein [Sulfoacidibacillus ferrooxidans]|uniref:hypothetical protein n=1 Tax=Sulfoacidibacillus ferrooxidans TaxID=2005001 RepID=UPI001F504D25|nr:hypothetical protein [Sulfoacidibacillus ferrooxidans]
MEPITPVVIGCVDHAITRKLLHEQVHTFRDGVYIDSGNGGVTVTDDPEHINRYQLAKIKATGWVWQMVVGVRKNGQDVMPFPGEVFSNLLEAEEGENLPRGITTFPVDPVQLFLHPLSSFVPCEQHCGEVVVSQAQRLMTNLPHGGNQCTHGCAHVVGRRHVVASPNLL